MNAAPLVLITRSESAGRDLAEKVLARDLDALHCAPFALEGPERPARVGSRLRSHLPADRVIITSQEGVRRSVELVGAESFSRSLVIVPGEGTGRLALELGMEHVVWPSGQGTSEAILAMPELLDVEGLDILILAAEGGRGLMGRVLEERGASVERLHVYRRVKKALPGDIEQRLARAGSVIVLAASWEGVSGLAEGLSDRAMDYVRAGAVVAPSQRVADRAEELGIARVVIARGADDEAMLAALEQLTSQSGLR